MLTGDQNLVMVNWEVRYKISKLEHFLFKVRDPVDTLRAVSEAVMRIEVGDRSVDEALTLERTQIENAVMKKMQTALDDFQCGIRIVKVNLKNVDPPDAVKDAFNAVNRAVQVRNRIVNEAEGERNKKVPAARGQADRAIKEAEGYEIGRLNRAVVRQRRFYCPNIKKQGMSPDEGSISKPWVAHCHAPATLQLSIVSRVVF